MQAIGESYPHGAQQQTRRTPLLLSIDGTDDRRTLDRFVNPAGSAYYAVIVARLCNNDSMASTGGWGRECGECGIMGRLLYGK